MNKCDNTKNVHDMIAQDYNSSNKFTVDHKYR